MKKPIDRLPFLVCLFLIRFFASCTEHSTEPASDVDQSKIDAAFAQASQVSNLRCLVVWHNGTIVREAYYGTAGPGIAHDVLSVTKSVTALLVGIALEKGYIESIDQPMGDFLRPIYPSIPQEKANITIRHLLTMSGGFQWHELSVPSDYSNWMNSANQVQYMLDRPLVAQPGQVFAYDSGALHLLSVIVSQATGRQTKDFAQEYVFNPLGIGERNWEVDHQGYNNGAAGLQITPHDMVKLGELVLNHGEYGDKRVVSSDWIDQMTRTQIFTGDTLPYGPGYGYCWWIGQSGGMGYAFANGWGGQFIVVVPDENLVVVATNQWSGVTTSVANDQWYTTITLIMTNILPAFKKTE
jgi:CubicO group peptidase (beta-lactamase class C family)